MNFLFKDHPKVSKRNPDAEVFEKEHLFERKFMIRTHSHHSIQLNHYIKQSKTFQMFTIFP